MTRTLLSLAAFSFLLAGALPAAEPAKTPIILDCALGNEMDDALALALATSLPEVDLLAVTTCRKDAEVRAWMACRFLHAVDRRMVPVAFGRGEQPPGDVGPRYQYRNHPALIYNRMGKPAKETAVELMASLLKGKKKEVTIVCTGPLTNVAQLLKEHPEAAEGIKQIVISVGTFAPRPSPGGGRFIYNFELDFNASQAVFGSKVDRTLIDAEGTKGARFGSTEWKKVFAPCTLRGTQLQALWQLSDEPESVLTDALAVALASGRKEVREFCKFGDPVGPQLEGRGDGRPLPKYLNVSGVQGGAFADWLIKELTRDKPALPRENKNYSQLVERGNFPARVHAFEDYNGDIERRWWMAGKEETKIVPDGGQRACRSVLTQDFDDRQGDLTTMYNSVTFNPVPGPPMGKNTRLSFRYYLIGTGELRIQLYSLTNGYHRYLTLRDLPQDKWMEGCVDMTQMRRPDGMGGALAENERIDDVQFYVDPRAEVIIDEFVLFDAAAEGETRPFPKAFHFTGWFDTGRQGGEWPGKFEIVPDAGNFWKAAKSVTGAVEPERPGLRINLRGARPLGKATKLDFAAKLTGGDSVTVTLVDTKSGKKLSKQVAGIRGDSWTKQSLFMQSPGDAADARPALFQADEIWLTAPQGATLLVDDLLLYEP